MLNLKINLYLSGMGLTVCSFMILIDYTLNIHIEIIFFKHANLGFIGHELKVIGRLGI